jgi:hypothetical protein
MGGEERLRAVLGFVVRGGLLPELFGELREMMWPAWWDCWEGEADVAVGREGEELGDDEEEEGEEEEEAEADAEA